MAPHVRHPGHSHSLEEVYVSLAGGEWRLTNMDWTAPGPGGLIYNEPGVLHARRTTDELRLAIWCLRIGNA